MTASSEAKKYLQALSDTPIRMGELKKMAKAIKKNQSLAMELWDSGKFYPRMLSTLIFDKKSLDQSTIDELVDSLKVHENNEQHQILDWLLANQLMKDKACIVLLEGWRTHKTSALRRLFWYHQARLRWTGQPSPESTAELVPILEKELANETSEVQWTMNFCAAQIAIHQEEYRNRFVALGEQLELYKDEVVAKNCTPSYLPEFIRIEVGKRKG